MTEADVRDIIRKYHQGKASFKSVLSTLKKRLGVDNVGTYMVGGKKKFIINSFSLKLS